jgi:hypothetical protein
VLRRFQTTRFPLLFGNHGRAVIASQSANLDHSLVLITADGTEFHHAMTSAGKRQLRARFRYGDHEYDLPVTDPEFEREFARCPPSGPSFQSCFLTVSLGVEFEGWHHKLVAGVFLL